MRKLNLSIILPNGLMFFFGLFLLTTCGKSSDSDQPKIGTSDETTKTTQQSVTDSIDACSLLSKEEVEKVVGRSVLDPKSEQAANLFTCTYGDPEYPGVSVVVGISVIISSNNAQAKEILEIGRGNAASVEEVSNLGNDAYWDKILRTLWIVKDKYQVSIEVASDAGGLDTAKKLAMKVLERLP